jgi:hypothetical protein
VRMIIPSPFVLAISTRLVWLFFKTFDSKTFKFIRGRWGYRSLFDGTDGSLEHRTSALVLELISDNDRHVIPTHSMGPPSPGDGRSSRAINRWDIAGSSPISGDSVCWADASSRIGRGKAKPIGCDQIDSGFKARSFPFIAWNWPLPFLDLDGQSSDPLLGSSILSGVTIPERLFLSLRAIFHIRANSERTESSVQKLEFFENLAKLTPSCDLHYGYGYWRLRLFWRLYDFHPISCYLTIIRSPYGPDCDKCQPELELEEKNSVQVTLFCLTHDFS